MNLDNIQVMNSFVIVKTNKANNNRTKSDCMYNFEIHSI